MVKDHTSTEFVGKNEGLVWTLFIVLVIFVGFVSVVTISGSSQAELAIDITASTVNTVPLDVDITIVPEDVLR